jgi:hypothetical protein
MTLSLRIVPPSFVGNRARAIAVGVVVACAVYMPGSLYGQGNWQPGTNPTWVPAGTKVGIGQPNPISWSSLHVNGAIYATSDIVTEGVFKSNTTSGSNYFMSKVGIGTTAPQHLLHVAGTIGAQDVIVSSTGADYVFNPAYRLRPLTEVASYIKEHHHLPEIPSEAEVKEKGVSLGDMQAKLLAKVEELTLHLIQADEKNRELQERIARLERDR